MARKTVTVVGARALLIYNLNIIIVHARPRML